MATTRYPYRGHDRGQGGTGWAWIVGLVVLLVIGLFLWAIFAAADDDRFDAARGLDRPGVAPPGAVAPGRELDRGVTIDQIAETPNTFVGRSVTVSGEVDDVLGPRAFTLEDSDLLFDEKILVVGARAIPTDAGLRSDQFLRVTGPVRMFNIAEVEREIGFDLDDNLFRDWVGKPAIVATSINYDVTQGFGPAMAGPRGPVTAPSVAPGVEPIGAIEPFADATISGIVGNPALFAGRRVGVSGEVERVVMPHAFLIQEEGVLFTDELLVVGTRNAVGLPGAPVAAGAPGAFNWQIDQPMWAVGQVRTFNIVEVEREIGFDLDDNVFREFEGRPVLVARAVLPSPEIDDLTGDVNRYAGRIVAVQGEVDEFVFGPGAFKLEGDDLLGGGEILVVNTQRSLNALGVPAPTVGEARDQGVGGLVEDREVRVFGTVRAFNLVEVEREIGFDLDDNRFREFEGKPVIVARGIDLTAETPRRMTSR